MANQVNITPGQLDAIYLDISAQISYTYMQIYGGEFNWAKRMVQVVKTSLDTITLPMLRNLIGLNAGIRHQTPTYRTLTADKAEVTVSKYEDAIEISVHDIANDMLDLYRPEMNRIAESAALLCRDRLINSLILGDTSAYPTWDGVNFFDNAHPKGGTTFDNLSAGVLTNLTFQAERTRMQQFPSDAGAARPLGVVPNELIVPSALEITAAEILNNSMLAQATFNTENQLKGRATLVMAPELTDATDWYVACTDKPVKPWVHLQKTGFSPFSTNWEGQNPDSIAFKQEMMRVFGWTYEEVYPVRPEFAIKVVN